MNYEVFKYYDCVSVLVADASECGNESSGSVKCGVFLD